ncbi:MAG: protoheme IX farnesyltransferase [Planctomycetes bacterium]|nr:protoheme IX farnesyltransferase [Planctomycetota bacterium]
MNELLESTVAERLDVPRDLRSLALARATACLELSKPTILGLVLVATCLGFYLAAPGGTAGATAALLLPCLLGTSLVAAGANALNQYLEADYDRRMARTADRPIPSGRLAPREAMAFGLTSAVAGFITLAAGTNLLAALVAGTTLVVYVCLYTPLKRVTPLCVFVGAVPGALPPVIGWSAAAGSLSVHAWLLFAIVFFWQLPHVAAIAWLYRDDYRRAGYRMLSVVDGSGTRTNLHMITHTVGLIAASLFPTFYGLAGATYAVGAVLLGLGFLGFGVWFVLRRTTEVARLHLLASVTYLPLLCALMMMDKVPAV